MVDVLVTIPSGKRIELQGIATDTVADIRLLLAQHVATCHLTNYGLRSDSETEEDLTEDTNVRMLQIESTYLRERVGGHSLHYM